MRNYQSKLLKWFISINFAVLLPLFTMLSPSAMAQSDSEFRDDHPDRYVVQEGDTLWAIAKRFLKDPWRWPLIWRENGDIENPHLIFPGDLLVVTSDLQIKSVRLQPKAYVQTLDRAITTIPPNAIHPFLTSAIILEPGELDGAGHVLTGVEDELVLGKYMKFYARGFSDTTAEEYRIFRIGETLRDPESGEVLGVEGIHLGDAYMDEAGEDVSKLQIFSANQEIRPTDRLIPMPLETPLPHYHPHAPSWDVEGWILYAPQGVSEVGRLDVVIVSGGKREGLEEGHVLKILLHRGTRTDPVNGEEYEVPEETSGLMMVFRVFEKLSYALILESTRAIAVGDRYGSP